MINVEGPERGCVEGEWLGVDPECRRGELSGVGKRRCMNMYVLFVDSYLALLVCVVFRFVRMHPQLE